MKRTVSSSSSSSSSSIIITFVLVFIACCSLAEAASSSSSSSYKEEIIPNAIAAPSGNVVHLGLEGVGVQHYSFNGSSWLLVNATAQLYHLNTIVAQHFYLPEKDSQGGQPTWKSTLDSSSVTAKALLTTTPNPNSIPWTLLQATRTTPTTSSNKDSYFGAVTYVQRINTEGGLQPSYLGTNVGDLFFSPYTAIYLFYTQHDF